MAIGGGENNDLGKLVESANLAEGFHLQINSPNSQKEIVGNNFSEMMKNFVELKQQILNSGSAFPATTHHGKNNSPENIGR